MQNPFDPGYYDSDELSAFGFKSIGEGVRISKAANIVGLTNIEIGSNVRIDPFTSIVANTGYLKLGSNIHIGSGCLIGAHGGVEFDDFSGLSHGVKLVTATDDFSGGHMLSYCVPIHYLNVKVAPVRIGRHAVVCANSVVLPGTTLGDGAIVGALSLAKGTLKGWAIHCGAPARQVSERSRGVIDLESEYRGECRNVK